VALVFLLDSEMIAAGADAKVFARPAVRQAYLGDLV